jgi:hypothetical protein
MKSRKKNNSNFNKSMPNQPSFILKKAPSNYVITLNYNKQDGEHAAVKRWLKEHGRK